MPVNILSVAPDNNIKNSFIFKNCDDVSNLNTSPLLSDISASVSNEIDDIKVVNDTEVNIGNNGTAIFNTPPSAINRNNHGLMEYSSNNDANYMCIPNVLEGMSEPSNVNMPPNKDFCEFSVNDSLISEPNVMENNRPSNYVGSELDETTSTQSLDTDSPDIAHTFNNLRIQNTNKLVIGQLNINSLRNKFEALKCIIKDNLDILILSETKLDSTFPKNQFILDGYNHFRFDKNSNSGGQIIFVREDIPCKILPNTEWPNELEGIFMEINLRKTKWLLFTGYNPHKQFIFQFLHSLSKCIEKLVNKYDNILLLGDFNSEPVENDMNEFCNVYGLKNLIKEPTCYKNALNPTCIDLILTNKFNKFQNSKTIETGLSDFHKMTVTVLKTFFQKKSAYVY